MSKATRNVFAKNLMNFIKYGDLTRARRYAQDPMADRLELHQVRALNRACIQWGAPPLFPVW